MTHFVLDTFLSGALMMAFVIAGLFFLRFWKRTHDNLFMAFALAFWMMAIERVALIINGAAHEGYSLLYLIRLLAFFLIIAAVLEKNRNRKAASDTPPDQSSRAQS